MFDKQIGIDPVHNPLGFHYAEDCFGPQPEFRYLCDVRKSLRDPKCQGPEILYTIAMDVGKKKDRILLDKMHLLFGVVTFSAGKLGEEPIRSQGHIHKISPFSGTSTPELYEIWSGKAIIYMQETAQDQPGCCFAVEASPGDQVIVPPGWAHCTISADSEQPLTFGAWCDREYGFEYEDVRFHGGLAYFPILNKKNLIYYEHNDRYAEAPLIVKKPRGYTEFGLIPKFSIYRQFEENTSLFRFIPVPAISESCWIGFIP